MLRPNDKPIAFISEVYLHHRLREITCTPLGKVSADHGRFGRACVFVGILVVVFACAAWLFVLVTKRKVVYSFKGSSTAVCMAVAVATAATRIRQWISSTCVASIFDGIFC